MLANLNDLLPRARKEGYAVGMFNTVNLEMARGVLQAAEDMRSPVIIGTAEILLPYASLWELSHLLLPMADKAAIPVAVHFDHGLTPEAIDQAIRLGFTSVMYDCSTLPFEENAARVAELVRRAHPLGVTVEAELGHVGTAEDDSPEAAYTSPQEALRFVQLTEADALAVAVGTAHGAYRQAPRLDFERLSHIASLVPAPLVLHGGSGLSETDFKETIRRGIAKVNIFTDINNAQAKCAHDRYFDGMGMTDLMNDMTAAVRMEALKKMALFGSGGRC